MYQMLTGVLPYDTPAPADLDRLMRGELVVAAAAQEPDDPEGDQRHRHEGDGAGRSRRATSAPAICSTTCSRRASAGAAADAAPTPVGDAGRAAPARRRAGASRRGCEAREAPQPRFCWHCRKPLHARADRCPFCGETQ